MRLLVNKFMLRHNGRLYKAGDSLELPDTLAVSLAEKSAGAYSLIDVPKGTKKEAIEDIAADYEETTESVEDVAEVLEKATAKATTKSKTATRKTNGAKK